MQTTDKEKTLEWQHFYLPNIPIYQTKLPQDIVDRLWSYIDEAIESANKDLAGNIGESLYLVDKEDYFFRYVINPVANLYVNNVDGVSWIQNHHTLRSKSLVMNRFWVNFQNQHEFNPIHYHSGLLSFVVWMKIPTHHEQQHALPICKKSNAPSASDFQFIYSDVLGGHHDHRVKMADYQEGWIVVFPAQLQHQVYPFYECDEQRVSISGNIYWNSMDLELW